MSKHKVRMNRIMRLKQFPLICLHFNIFYIVKHFKSSVLIIHPHPGVRSKVKSKNEVFWDFGWNMLERVFNYFLIYFFKRIQLKTILSLIALSISISSLVLTLNGEDSDSNEPPVTEPPVTESPSQNQIEQLRALEHVQLTQTDMIANAFIDNKKVIWLWGTVY